MKQDAQALNYAYWGLTKDKEIVMEAVKQNGRALQYADRELTEDEKFMEEAAKASRTRA